MSDIQIQTKGLGKYHCGERMNNDVSNERVERVIYNLGDWVDTLNN